MIKKLLFCLGVVGFTANLNAQVNDCLPNWQYRNAVNVSNSNSTPLLDHQVKLTFDSQTLITDGKLKMDGSDLRFQGACCIALCYWIESGMNTPTTTVWVKVDSVPAMGSTDIFMVYGNAAATSEANASCVFDLYDDFDNDQLNAFTEVCGVGTTTFASGQMSMSWSNDATIGSNATFPVGNVYTAEMDVVNASGSWPGLYWFKETASTGYGTLMGSGQVRISVSSEDPNFCQGHNWASAQLTYGSPVGQWTSTWVATGNILADFPSVGPISTTDVLHAKNEDLRLFIGGIDGGTGSMIVNSVRVRKYAVNAPTFNFGAEGANTTTVSFVQLNIDTTSICPMSETTLVASPNFASYLWSDGSMNDSLIVSAGGQYSVIGTDMTGCQTGDTVVVLVYTAPVAGFTSAVVAAAGNFTNASTGATTYFWDFGNGMTSIAQNPSNQYTVNDNYIACLIATSADGCADTICQSVVIGDVSIAENNLNKAVLAPNPVVNNLTLEIQLANSTSFIIVDELGRVVLNGVLNNGMNIIQTSKLNKGVYFLKWDVESTQAIRFVKN